MIIDAPLELATIPALARRLRKCSKTLHRRLARNSIPADAFINEGKCKVALYLVSRQAEFAKLMQ